MLLPTSVTLATLGLLSTFPITTSKQVYPGFKKLQYLFSFGDSYTQTGFNLTNGSPLPTSGNPLGNPVYPGWTSANGPAWIDYLTVEFNKSELLTYNLAYGGATVDSALVTPWRPDVLSLKDQIETLFLPILGPKPSFAPWKPSNSLFLIWIGVNDIGNSYWNQDYDNFHNILLDAYFSLIDKLYSSGARNFVLLNVPAIHRSPLTVGQGAQAVDLETKALASINSKLENRVKGLLKKKADVWAKVFDTFEVFNKVIDKPKAYGLKISDSYCEAYQNGTPAPNTFYPECSAHVDEYFWLNSLHPTFTVHKVVARELAKSL